MYNYYFFAQDTFWQKATIRIASREKTKRPLLLNATKDILGLIYNVIEFSLNFKKTAKYISFVVATKSDITAMGSDGARLITAASDNAIDSVKDFLYNKVDVNSRDWDNLTALIAASGKGHLQMVKYLVQNKAEINLRDKDNITAFMEASMGGYLDVVKFLVDSGAEVETIAASGVSPLWLASGEGHLDVVEYLLSKNTNPNNKRMDGNCIQLNKTN